MQINLGWSCPKCKAGGEIGVFLSDGIVPDHKSVIEFWPALKEAHRILSPDCPIRPGSFTVGVGTDIIQSLLTAR